MRFTHFSVFFLGTLRENKVEWQYLVRIQACHTICWISPLFVPVHRYNKTYLFFTNVELWYVCVVIGSHFQF